MINATQIPRFLGDLTAIERAGSSLSKVGQQISGRGAEVHSAFQGLAASYRAPEAGQLLNSTLPVKTASASFGADISAVGSALTAFAAQAQPIVSRLETLRGQAQAFEKSVAGNEHWTDSQAKVDQNNSLLSQVNAAVVAFEAVDAAAANKIQRLYGGELFHPGTLGKSDPYAYVSSIPTNAATPWGSPAQQSAWYQRFGDWVGGHLPGFLRPVWNAYYSFEEGVWVDGAWGTLKGLGLIGIDSFLWSYGLHSSAARVAPGLVSQADGAMENLGYLAAGVALNLTPSVGLGVGALAASGKMPSWASNAVWKSDAAVVNTAKGFVAWDEWNKDPARAAGNVTFNVGTLFLPGPKGLAALFKGGQGADLGGRALAEAGDSGADATGAGAHPVGGPVAGDGNPGGALPTPAHLADRLGMSDLNANLRGMQTPAVLDPRTPGDLLPNAPGGPGGLFPHPGGEQIPAAHAPASEPALPASPPDSAAVPAAREPALVRAGHEPVSEPTGGEPAAADPSTGLPHTGEPGDSIPPTHGPADPVAAAPRGPGDLTPGGQEPPAGAAHEPASTPASPSAPADHPAAPVPGSSEPAHIPAGREPATTAPASHEPTTTPPPHNNPASGGPPLEPHTAHVDAHGTGGGDLGNPGHAGNLAHEAAEALAKLPDNGQATLSDGSWIGKEHGQALYLNPKANAAADRLLEHASAAEPGITREMQSVTDSLRHGAPDSRLLGPDVGKQLKSAFSLKRKMSVDLKDPGVNPGAVASKVNDAVRYTIELPPDHYADGVNQAVERLRADGYQPVKAAKDFWEVNRGVRDYKGINSTWRDPATGQPFELQFHTPGSLAAKEAVHPYYEVARLDGVTDAQRAEALAKSKELFSAVAEPPGVDRIHPIKP